MLRDIRDHLPRSKQTDPNNFPEYRYQPYPRMMSDENGKPCRDKYNNLVIVKSEAEELAFKNHVSKPVAAKSIDIQTIAPHSIAENLPETNDSNDEPAKRRGRPPKLPQDLT